MKRASHHAIFLFGLIAFSSAANATPIEFVPVDQDVDLGNQVLVDIVVTPDFGVLIGEFDFIVNFDASVLSVFDVVFGASLGDGQFTSFQSPFDLGGGMLNLAEVSLLLDLTSLQDGSPFLLATIIFNTLNLGTSDLSFTGNIFGQVSPFNFLGGEFGFPLFADPRNGSISVIQAPVAVPEPPTWALLMIGLLALSACRKKFLK